MLRFGCPNGNKRLAVRSSKPTQMQIQTALLLVLAYKAHASTMTSKKVGCSCDSSTGTSTTTTSISTTTSTGSSSGGSGGLTLKDADKSGGDLSKITEVSYYYEWKYPDTHVFYDQYTAMAKKNGFIIAVGEDLSAKTAPPGGTTVPDRCIGITNRDNSRTVAVKIVDKCAECTQTKPFRMDMSNVAFNELVGGACEAEKAGVLKNISVRWVQCPTDDELAKQLTLKPTIDEAYKKCNGSSPP